MVKDLEKWDDLRETIEKFISLYNNLDLATKHIIYLREDLRKIDSSQKRIENHLVNILEPFLKDSNFNTPLVKSSNLDKDMFLNIPIKSLNLWSYDDDFQETMNKSGIVTLGDLVLYTKKGLETLEFSNKSTITMIEILLESFGLKLHSEIL